MQPVPPRHRRRRWLVVVLLALAAVFTSGLGPANADAAEGNAPQRWIVALNDDAVDVQSFASVLSQAFGGELDLIYEHAVKGFAVTMTPAQADLLRTSSWVDVVEADQEVSVLAQSTPDGVVRVGVLDNADVAITGAADGSGTTIDVDVAVIDTGVDLEHPDLNVVGSVDCTVDSGSGSQCGAGGDDDNYHGTHVAGTIGALDNDIGVVGVAPGARIWAVKVLNAEGRGSLSDVIAGLDWVTERADVIDVVNMSLSGSGYSEIEYQAIQNAVDAGVSFAVAAGNNGLPAADFSPAAFDNVLTVSSMADYDGAPGGFGTPTCRSEPDDTLATYSNRGSAVDIAAPGNCVVSTVPVELGGYGRLSGTSMAAPHVAGGLALLAANARPTDAAGVHALYATVLATGNNSWQDNSNDGWFEPLLDVSRFSPVAGLLAPLDSAPGSGDVNCDRVMSIVDALQIAQFVTGVRAESASCAFGGDGGELFTGAGDLNDDQEVTIVDALLIARCVTGLDVCTP